MAAAYCWKPSKDQGDYARANEWESGEGGERGDGERLTALAAPTLAPSQACDTSTPHDIHTPWARLPLVRC
ncbi:hypothetical protein XM38_025390 [Halomicronema hongdechloris C2206]|uniref:Uncharacterized protein n=1 Tax=Halomicronema hongdechloris C2206 TaxID=1641165 RepID=A0A1Z3HN66_9CYAN|nr:hypothetical protein XM38_025390 [Halomicronema hongdechloris C2206]